MDDGLIAQVKPGMDVQPVLSTLGTPSTTSTVGNRTFYYISQRVRRRFQFQDLTVIDQNVLVIYFNKGFKVERIANYGLQDGVIFDFISRTTATGGEEQSFLRNLFRGVTKFTARGWVPDATDPGPAKTTKTPRLRPRGFSLRPPSAAQSRAGLRSGSVIAVTPTTTRASPAQAVGLRRSPRKTMPMATPIGTRR